MAKGLPGIPLEDRLIVALDTGPDEALALVRQLRPAVGIFKVGLQLLMAAGGLGILERLREEGVRVFLDLKMLDIPETVGRALAEVQARHPHVVFTTVHAFNRGLESALRARPAGSALQVLVVTLLTSMDTADLAALGIARSVEDFVLEQAGRAAEAGCDGVIASGLEAPALRARYPALRIVTPGVRPATGQAGSDDQKRVVTPAQAILNGADHLVVGRPVTRPPAGLTPADAARAILAEVRTALAERGRG